MKKVEKSYGMHQVFESIKTLKHGNDGLIFTSAVAPYQFGTCDKMLK
jgi:mRNA guanylyltransferase